MAKSMGIQGIHQVKKVLDNAYRFYHRSGFIENDPIRIPHSFTLKQDIEIAGFLTAIIAWGQRKSILNNAESMMSMMGNAPYDFLLNHQSNDLKKMESFVHRTFNSTDLLYFIAALKSLYKQQDSLAYFFKGEDTYDRILSFRKAFFNTNEAPERTFKHVANPAKGSAAKRINMFLKWMVRKDSENIDFGMWDTIPTSELVIPLDVHVHRVSLELGLTTRKQANWKTAQAITEKLRLLDPLDPVRYDYALFMMGVEKRRQVTRSLRKPIVINSHNI